MGENYNVSDLINRFNNVKIPLRSGKPGVRDKFEITRSVKDNSGLGKPIQNSNVSDLSSCSMTTTTPKNNSLLPSSIDNSTRPSIIELNSLPSFSENEKTGCDIRNRECLNKTKIVRIVRNETENSIKIPSSVKALVQRFGKE